MTVGAMLTISKEDGQFLVEDLNRPGSPPVGRAYTVKAAIGDYFLNNQERFGICFRPTEAVQPIEDARRRRAMAER